MAGDPPLSVAPVLAVLLAAAPAWGQEQRYTELQGSSRSLYAIAVPSVLDGGAAAAQAREVQAVLSRDLTLWGLAKILNPKSFLANLSQEGMDIDAESWARVGAQAVIKARMTLTEGKLLAEFRFHNVEGGTVALERSYEGSATSARALAHLFGDEVVYHLTGERGVFSTRIAFAEGSKGRSQIMVVDFDGHGPQRASRTGEQNLLPAWSPSGQLAWTSFLWGNPDLYVASGPGGRPQRVSRHPGLNSGAAFSPDGRQIALTLTRDGDAEIYIIGVDGGQPRRLTESEGIDVSPTWSPDGSQISFVSDRAGSPQIYVVSAAGGQPRRITFKGGYNQEPDWCTSAGSTLVAFTGRDDQGAYDVYTIDVASGELKRLTQGQGDNRSPRWGPNGRLLVFSSSRGGLWIMDSDGLSQQQVFKGPARTPAWSR